ncbi:unnamed protein product, partial [Durusdinium trenchii]
ASTTASVADAGSAVVAQATNPAHVPDEGTNAAGVANESLLERTPPPKRLRRSHRFRIVTEEEADTLPLDELFDDNTWILLSSEVSGSESGPSNSEAKEVTQAEAQ